MAPYGYTGAPTSSNRYHRNNNANANDAQGHGGGSPVTPAVTGIDYPSNEDVSVEADLYTTNRRDLNANANPGYYPPTAYRGGGHNNSYGDKSYSSQSQSYSVSQNTRTHTHTHTRSHSRSQSQSQSQSMPHSNSHSRGNYSGGAGGLYTHPNIAGSTLDSPPFPSFPRTPSTSFPHSPSFPPSTTSDALQMPEDSHTRALTAVWDRIRAEKEAKMAREKPKVQSLDEMAQEFLVINDHPNRGGYNGYNGNGGGGGDRYNEDSYNSRSNEKRGQRERGQRSDRDRGDRRQRGETDSERRQGGQRRGEGRIPVMEASSPPTVSPPPISAGKGHGNSRSMRKPKSISNFRESTDGTAMVATFDLPEVVDKQDIHISFQRNRLVLTWEVGEVTEWVDGGEDEDEESRAHDFDHEQEDGGKDGKRDRDRDRQRDGDGEEREGGRVVLREHVRRMYHRTLPLPEGTRFEEIQAQMTSKGLILRYPNMRCFRVDGRSRSGDS